MILFIEYEPELKKKKKKAKSKSPLKKYKPKREGKWAKIPPIVTLLLYFPYSCKD